MKTTTYTYDRIINATSAVDAAKDSMREVIFNAVLARTAEKTKVDDSVLAMLQDKFVGFCNARKIVVEIDGVKSVINYTSVTDWSMSAWLQASMALLRALDELECYFEDTITNGFCWNSPAGHAKVYWVSADDTQGC